MHAGLINHLDRLVILEDVKISSGQRGVISIQGPNAPTLVEQITTLRPVQFLQTASWRGGLVVARTRSPEAGVDLILPLELIDEIEQRLDQEGVVTSSPEATERARIESGFPRSGQDVTERSMPPEVGLDDAISYDKGCYAGQEVLARIRTYGHVNRQLRRIEFQFPEGVSTASVAPGDALHSSDGEGKSAGKITSVAKSENGFSLMASVRKNHIDEGTVLCWQGVSDDGSSLKLSGEVRFPFRP
jgi:folate-binding protein YgfZ